MIVGATFSKWYAASRPIRRELTIYDTARLRANFGNEVAIALLDQVRDS